MDPAKRKRSVALSHFTKSVNSFTKLVDISSPCSLVTPAFEKVKSCWETLETAHDNYIEVAEVDIDTDPGGLAFLDEPGERLDEVLVRYSTFLKEDARAEKASEAKKAEDDRLLEDERRKRLAKESKDAEEVQRQEEAERKFENAKAEFFSTVDSFQRLNLGFQDSLEVGSEHDLRDEWSKIESEFNSLKARRTEIVGIDHNQDIAEVNARFKDVAEVVFLGTQKAVLEKLKDTSGGKASGRGGNDSIKKEAVKLPQFQGNEKDSPYLKFPVWKQQWDDLIADYDVKFRFTMLWKSIDEEAQSKLVGCERDYEEAIKRLTKFYGNPLKVVSCVIREVTAQQTIADKDYGALVSYSMLLERSYGRLESMKLEHELSNSSAMSAILKKFPCSVAEKWNESLSQKSDDEISKPFPVFIAWLKDQVDVWERMIASGVGRKEFTSKN